VVGYLDRNAPRGGYAVELLSNLFNLFEPHKALERFTSLGCTAVFGTPIDIERCRRGVPQARALAVSAVLGFGSMAASLAP